MTVSQLTVDPFTNMPILILRDKAGEALPIWIGLLEASAIATELEKIALARPMTHDLLKSLIAETGLKLASVEIHDVRDNTFYALLRLSGPRGRVIEIDARPSDAVALALRAGAPIRVARKVVRKARLSSGACKSGEAKLDLDFGQGPGHGHGQGTKKPGPGLLERLSDDDFGKWKM